jgi:hypothetical protein
MQQVPRKPIAVLYLGAATLIVTRSLVVIGSGVSGVETALAIGIAVLFAVASVVVTIATLRR